MAPSPASSVSSECVTVLFNLTDCLTYVEAGSNTTKPDKPCCPELAGLIESNPICLCEMLAGAAESYGISVDNERALALPKICHISTPPLSTCAVLGIPVSDLSPAGAPGPSTSSPLLPAGSTAAAPSSGQSENGATGIDSVNLIVLIASSFILSTIAISEIF
ncbi:Non-specific lipid transfer protein GPI-anchored 2 [Carex littledalei]|uniref:Non-specific lipid transfer protein GPI-anchored 2 n=1 Tax=Carex littledalei TaxID=544730 RepID=A0A833R0U0_9POAL|nr:Non-specific lipid transfer protein GPI-anchored 2 [Carex littledalei]